MADKKPQLLRISLVLYAIMTLGYGIIYLFFPEFQIKMTGGEPILPGWIRWFGGVLLALGFGSILVFRNPEKQGIFVLSFCIGSLLVSLSLFYEILFVDFEDFNLMTTLLPAIILFIIAVLFWLSLRQSKELLW